MIHLLVQHDLDTIAADDSVIDLGPDEEHTRGRVVATGTPADIARAEGSRTPPCLAWAARGNIS